MLVTILPHAVVDSSIDPHVRTEAMFFVVDVITLEPPSIMPFVNSIPMHFVQFPFSIIAHHFRIIRKFALALEFAVFEFSFIDAALSELVVAFRSVFTVLVLSFIVGCSIVPCFFTFSILLIMVESSIIGITLLARFCQLTVALSIAVDKRALQDTQILSKRLLSFAIR